MKFRAKVGKMGDKIHIIIPKSYHKEARELLNEFVDVELIEV
jgi:flagellar motor switch protein FliM